MGGDKKKEKILKREGGKDFFILGGLGDGGKQSCHQKKLEKECLEGKKTETYLKSGAWHKPKEDKRRVQGRAGGGGTSPKRKTTKRGKKTTQIKGGLKPTRVHT